MYGKLFLILAFAASLGLFGCSLSSQKDSRIHDLKTSHFAFCQGLALSGSRMGPNGLRNVVACIDPLNELKLHTFLGFLTDLEIETLILDPFYSEIRDQPQQFYEIHHTYSELKRNGLLVSLLNDFGILFSSGLNFKASFQPAQFALSLRQQGISLAHNTTIAFESNSVHPFLRLGEKILSQPEKLSEWFLIVFKTLSQPQSREAFWTVLERFSQIAQYSGPHAGKLERISDSFMNLYVGLSTQGEQEYQQSGKSIGPGSTLPFRLEEGVELLAQVLDQIQALDNQANGGLGSFLKSTLSLVMDQLQEEPSGEKLKTLLEIALRASTFTPKPFNFRFDTRSIQGLDDMIAQKVNEIEGESCENDSGRLQQLHNEVTQAVRVTDLQEEWTTNQAGCLKPSLQTTWKLQHLQDILNPLLKKVLIHPTNDQYWMLDGVLKGLRYFTLKAGETPNTERHYPSSYFLEWAHPRALDLRPFQVYPRGCPAGDPDKYSACKRVILKSTLHRMSDVVDNENFSIFGKGTLGFEPVIPVLQDVARYNDAWGDFKDIAPPHCYENRGFSEKKCGSTLLQVAEKISSHRPLFSMLTVLEGPLPELLKGQFESLLNRGPHWNSLSILEWLFKPWQPSQATTWSQTFTHPVSQALLSCFTSGIQSVCESLRGQLISSLGERFTDLQDKMLPFIYNERAMGPVLAENAPGYSTAYPSGTPSPHSPFDGVVYPQGMEVLRDAIYALVQSTPPSFRNFKAADLENNHLNFILVLSRLGGFGLLAQFLQRYPQNHPPLVDMFQGLIELLTTPSSDPSIHPAFREWMVAAFPKKEKEQNHLESFWKKFEPFFTFYTTGNDQEKEKKWENLRNVSLYGLALLHRLESASAGTIPLILGELTSLSKQFQSNQLQLDVKSLDELPKILLEQMGWLASFLEKLYHSILDPPTQEEHFGVLARYLRLLFSPSKVENKDSPSLFFQGVELGLQLSQSSKGWKQIQLFINKVAEFQRWTQEATSALAKVSSTP